MRLYVCWGTFTTTPRPGGHPCGNAYRALREAGHDPEVIRSYGLSILPDALFNRTAGRQEVKKLTGSTMVPVLVTDDGEVIKDSKRIADWARARPAELRAHSVVPEAQVDLRGGVAGVVGKRLQAGRRGHGDHGAAAALDHPGQVAGREVDHGFDEQPDLLQLLGSIALH